MKVKFTKSQILIILNMQERADYVAESDGYPAECGRYKPFTKNTINSLVDKGIVRINRTSCDNTLFYLKPSVNFDKVPTLTFQHYKDAKR